MELLAVYTYVSILKVDVGKKLKHGILKMTLCSTSFIIKNK